MPRIPSGGPATINGVLYQMLWTLFQATKLRVDTVSVANDGEFKSASLVSEPLNGGDIHVESLGRIVVEQIKSRSNGRTWSVSQIITGVIPDLYQAFDASRQQQFRFITDGKQGRWTPATLAKKTDQIIHAVQQNRKRRRLDDEDEVVTRRNVETLLTNLTFVWEQTEDSLRGRVDKFLLDRMGFDTDLIQVRRALLMDLAERSRAGHVEIDPLAFFASHRLGCIPLTSESEIRNSALERLKRDLSLRHYRNTCDVRLNTSRRLMESWSGAGPTMVIVGESGAGKSWLLFAMATAAGDRTIPVYLESRETADATMLKIAETFWHIKGNDDGPSLERIVARRHKLIPNNLADPWLTVFVDNVPTAAAANQLIRQPWEGWGVQTVFSCSPTIAEQIDSQDCPRCRVEQIGEFTARELQRLLEHELGEDWADVPSDVFTLLRRPVLAEIFCKLVVQESDVEPENEYQLFAEFWRRLSRDGVILDSAYVERLAGRVVNNCSYPFSSHDVLAVCNGNEAPIQRAIGAGWLRSAGPGQLEFTHDRLLNWAVAQLIVSHLREDPECIAEQAIRMSNWLQNTERPSGRYLGYVLMDVVWLMTDQPQLASRLTELMECYESNWTIRTALYEDLLPTVGAAIVPVLVTQLRRKASTDDRRSIVRGLRAVRAGSMLTEIEALLNDTDRQIRRCGVLLAAEYPARQLLPRLWQTHCDLVRCPDDWLANEYELESEVIGESMDALSACVALNPDWIGDEIERSDVQAPVHSLVWLSLELDDPSARNVWNGHREKLFQLVKPEHQRCLVVAMSRFPDLSNKQWLIEQCNRDHDLIGPNAFQALARIDHETALQHLNEVPLTCLYRTRDVSLSRILAKYSESAKRRLLELLKGSSDPWTLARSFQGRAHWLDRPMLDVLIDALSAKIEAEPASETKPHSFCHELELLSGMSNRDHVDCLQKKSGSRFECQLLDLVRRIGPRTEAASHSATLEPAVRILARISSSGLTRAVNLQLACDSVFGQRDGLDHAAIRMDSETIELVTGIVNAPRISDNQFLAQVPAVRVLVVAGKWKPVVDYFERMWPKVDPSITALISVTVPLPSDEIERVRHRVSSEQELVPPGLVAVLGFSGDLNDADLVRSILAQSQPGCELALACIMALQWLGDHDPAAVSLLKRELGTQNDHSARYGLACNKCDDAMESLLERFRDGFEFDTAVNLLRDPRTRENAIEITVQYLRHEYGYSIEYHGDLSALVAHCNDDEVKKRIFSDPIVSDHLFADAFAAEGGFRIVGAKATAIAALRFVDAQQAERAFLDVDHYERERYPYLLVEIDSERAPDALLKQLAIEESHEIRAAIGRALSQGMDPDALQRLLKSDDLEEKVAACRAVGWAESQLVLWPEVRLLVDDASECVSDAASSAIDRLEALKQTKYLVEAIMSACDTDSIWAYLDAIIEIGAPLDEHCRLPNWATRISKVLHPYQRQHLRKALQDQRTGRP